MEVTNSDPPKTFIIFLNAMLVSIFKYDKLMLLEFINETCGFESIKKFDNGQTLKEDENWSLIF